MTRGLPRGTRSASGLEERLLRLDRGHDLAGTRLSSVLKGDTFNYVLDEGGQLVEERVNCFVERRGEGMSSGRGSHRSRGPCREASLWRMLTTCWGAC